MNNLALYLSDMGDYDFDDPSKLVGAAALVKGVWYYIVAYACQPVRFVCVRGYGDETQHRFTWDQLESVV